MGSEGFETKKIFVGGIPRTVNEGFLLIYFNFLYALGFILLKLWWYIHADEFGTFFSYFGEIKEHRIIRDHSTGGSRGFGFITFQTEQAVDDLLGMGNKLDFAGVQVSCVYIYRVPNKELFSVPQLILFLLGESIFVLIDICVVNLW